MAEFTGARFRQVFGHCNEVVRKVHACDAARQIEAAKGPGRAERGRPHATANVDTTDSTRSIWQPLKCQCIQLFVQGVEGLLRRHVGEVVQVHEQVRRWGVESRRPLAVARIVRVNGPLVTSTVILGQADVALHVGAKGLPEGRASAFERRSLGRPLNAFLFGEGLVPPKDACALGGQRAGLASVGSFHEGGQHADFEDLPLPRRHRTQQLAVLFLRRGMAEEGVERAAPIHLCLKRLLHLSLGLCRRLGCRRRGNCIRVGARGICGRACATAGVAAGPLARQHGTGRKKRTRCAL
mmetsp:Transcript_12334/g.36650  ORF Transcript_12334/g.36650 Transcript_12334/m.36650 type:complete len:296 (+) Transcript_12334:260-1147(+)